MATIGTESNGRRRVLFVADDDSRKTIRLGKLSRRDAEQICRHIEALNAAKISGQPVQRDVAGWLSSISDKLHDRIVRAGLVEPRRRNNGEMTISELIDAYIARRTDLKESTTKNFIQCRRYVLKILGDTELQSLTPANADDFKRMMLQDYSEAHVARMVKVLKQVFRDAVRRRVTGDNPFADLKPGNQRNPDRMRYIDRATIDRVIEHAPDAEWRLLIALSRYGGLRIPSEALLLTWQDVNFDTKRIVIRSPKTEHHAGKSSRVIPMFPELEMRLREVFEAAPEGSTYPISRYRSSAVNLRTQFLRIINRASVTPWPKLWHNLRASRQTELARDFPAHVVCNWIGNSEAVALAHYLQVTDDDFNRAAQNPAQHLHATRGIGLNPITLHHENRPELPGDAIQCDLSQIDLMPRQGLEP